MNEKFTEMNVKFINKKINYEKSNGEFSKMCMVNAQDRDGVERKAYAWGNLCDNLKVGNDVLTTEWVSPETEIKSDRYIIVKKI